MIGGRKPSNKSKEKVHIWKRVIVWEGVRRQSPTDGERGRKRQRRRERTKEGKGDAREKKVGEREQIEKSTEGRVKNKSELREREVNVHSIIVLMQKFKCLHTDCQQTSTRCSERRSGQDGDITAEEKSTQKEKGKSHLIP